MKRYTAPSITFRFPFRRRTLGTGGYNAPKKAGGATPPIKQFSQMKAGRPKPRIK